MEDSAPGLFVSEPGNKATPLASGERVAAVGGGGVGKDGNWEEHQISAT